MELSGSSSISSAIKIPCNSVDLEPRSKTLHVLVEKLVTSSGDSCWCEVTALTPNQPDTRVLHRTTLCFIIRVALVRIFGASMSASVVFLQQYFGHLNSVVQDLCASSCLWLLQLHVNSRIKPSLCNMVKILSVIRYTLDWFGRIQI